jgi:plasmid stability protein
MRWFEGSRRRCMVYDVGMAKKKHRTQLLLDDWQYEALKARSDREGESMSGLVRQVLTEHLFKDQVSGREKLFELEGIAADRQFSGEDHDLVLYGPTDTD